MFAPYPRTIQSITLSHWALLSFIRTPFFFRMPKEKVRDAEPEETIPSLLFSSRLCISLMSSLGYFCGVFVTMNLGMVIVCMDSQSAENLTAVNDTYRCSTNETADTIVSQDHVCNTDNNQGDPIIWNKEVQSHLLGAAYYGSIPAQIVVGWLSDKYGKNKLQMIWGNVVMGILSILSPILIQETSVPFYFAARIIIGVASCFAMSSIVPLLNNWKTSKEQGLLFGLAFAGASFARAVTYPISGFACEYLGGWESIFYLTGGSCILWSIAALFLVYDQPVSHPRITKEESLYIRSFQNKNQSKVKKKVAIPWKNILLSIPVWSAIITNLLFFAVIHGFMVYLPIYIKEILNFSVTENGVYSSLPSVIALIFRLIVGPIFDRVRSRNACSVTVVRKIFHAIGTIIPAICMIAVSQMDPVLHKYLVIGATTIGVAFNEVASIGGYTFAFLDMAPDFVGSLQGINFTIGASAGLVIPIIIGALTPNGTQEEWSHVYIMFGGLYLAAGLLWILTGTSELQSWGKMKETVKLELMDEETFTVGDKNKDSD